jgi:hypothetical protein
VRVHVHEHRDGILEEQGIGGGDEREGAGDNQVTRAEAGGANTQVQACRPRADSNGVLCPSELAEGLLEGLDFSPC